MSQTTELDRLVELTTKIEKTKERHFSMAHRKWPAVAPMEEERDALKTNILEAIASKDALIEQMAGALNFILAFYEPGQTYLDTNAWTRAEAGGRKALADAKAAGYFGG